MTMTKQRWEAIQAMRSGTELYQDSDGRIFLGDEPKKHSFFQTLLSEGYITVDPDREDHYILTEDGRTAEWDGKTPRNVQKAPAISVYIGSGKKREQRLQKLEQIAERFKLPSIAALVNRIADDLLEVREREA